jgi:hypothetical protein
MWESKTLHGISAYDLQRPDVDKTESSAWPRAGKIFPETTGFMMAIQDQSLLPIIIKSIFGKDLNATDDICRKC